MYYRNAQAAVVVYDVTKAASLEKAKTWVKEPQWQANPNIVIVLASDKINLMQPSQLHALHCLAPRSCTHRVAVLLAQAYSLLVRFLFFFFLLTSRRAPMASW